MTKIHVNNVSISYTEAGKRGNQTIVFAHPLLWGAEMFESFIAELATDFHVVAVDIHGHGESDSPHPLTLDQMTDDFYQLLNKLNLKNIVWLGYSVGGMLGMRLALAHPETISSLILIATEAHLDEPEIKTQTLQLWELFRDGHRADIAEPALQFFFARRTYEENSALVERFRDKLVNFGNVGGMFEAALAVYNRDDISEKIGSIVVPTLVIAGSEDVSATVQEAEFIASQIPHAQLKIVENSNHLLAVENPREVLEAIRAFLQ
jgi:3-oxoadipate enol-lactonase